MTYQIRQAQPHEIFFHEKQFIIPSETLPVSNIPAAPVTNQRMESLDLTKPMVHFDKNAKNINLYAVLICLGIGVFICGVIVYVNDLNNRKEKNKSENN